MIGGPPVHLMWSGMFNPERPQMRRRIEWRRIGAFFAPYWRQELLIVACIVLAAIAGLGPALFSKWIIDDALPQRDTRALALDAAGMAGAAVLGSLLAIVQGSLNSGVGEGIMRDIRTSLVAHLHRMPLSFFTQTKTGEILNRVSNDVDNVDNVVTGTLVTVVTNAATMLVTVASMLVLDWRLALLALAVVPFMVLPISPVGRRMYEIRKITRRQRDEILSLMQETLSISGIMLVKSFTRERDEAARFYAAGTELMNLEIRLAMVGRWFAAAVNAMVVVGPAIVWFGGGWIALRGGVTVGTVVAFVALLARLYTPASALVGIQVQIVSALAVFERIFEYLDLVPEGVRADGTDAPLRPAEIRGELRFERVGFGYRTDRPVLDDVTLAIAPGSVAALVGPSGGGKTTITQLVSRFYDPASGAVRLDGVDLRDLDLEWLRAQIGIVSQETYLFHDTIAANLRYGKPGAALDALERAARAASIHDFIASLPDGYETVVGERGHKLSGGERQRLAIARVLLKDPRILVLDEATSQLDSENEAAIQGALEVAMRGRTSLVIAHRLSTIRRADVIFVIDRGRVVDVGHHTELLARGGLYATLYQTQFRDTARA